MIHLYTGDGKGKTTAAVGLAVRARGHGRRVLFVQFLKGGPTGELAGLAALGIEILRAPAEHGFWWTLDAAEQRQVVAEHDALLQRVLDACRGDGPPELLVLDEFTYVFTQGLADRTRCRQVLETVRAQGVELVLTGRDAGDELTALADYVSEVHAVRHPFTQGVAARAGVEF